MHVEHTDTPADGKSAPPLAASQAASGGTRDAKPPAETTPNPNQRARVTCYLPGVPAAVCVYCASSNHVDPLYFDDARALGRLLAEAGHPLVYGGGKVGLMGEVARAIHAHGGKVIGVIPSTMTGVEIAYHDADELIITDTMRQRKQIMEDRADAFITLPGGFGTLEEISEMIVGRLLGFHDKPIVLLNSHGFYDPLLTLFDHFIKHRFAKPEHLGAFTVVDTPEAAVAALGEGGGSS